jgi:putative acetyltransferase
LIHRDHRRRLRGHRLHPAAGQCGYENEVNERGERLEYYLRHRVARNRSAMPNRLLIREMRPEDARAFLEVHHAAVRGLANKDYSSEVIEAWAPMPITTQHVEAVQTNPDSEYRLVAEIDGWLVGIGCIVAEKNEMRACYVTPSASRRGVGSALLREIERAAREQRSAYLEAESSLTAEPFYSSNGYQVRERAEHVLHNGQRMACIKMRKAIVLQNS